jgi:CRISPR-associated endonuclease/helicase Cas3
MAKLMMNILWYAHSTQNPGRDNWETMPQHEQRVACTAQRHAAVFGAGILGSVAGLLHDLGKYDPDFKRRLEGDHNRHDHSTAGAVIAERLYPRWGKLLAFIIAGHHTGLANGTPGNGTRRALTARLTSGQEQADKAFARAQAAGLMLPENLDVSFAETPTSPGFTLSFFTHMLFSALVDADSLETERFYVSVGECVKNRDYNHPPLAELKARLDTALAAKLAKAKASSLNMLRAKVLTHAQAKAALPSGLFTLTVPTGGGKTLTSLSFALNHAVVHAKRRVIYVIPFTSIIEQTAGEFRGVLNVADDDLTTVLEHHSGFDATLTTEDSKDDANLHKLASENWDSPLVITTAVQFFESLFANQKSRCRKLHNIANSVIILDEAQTLPEPYLRPCIAALKELAANYGCTIVLCTATQPALSHPDFKGGFEITPERELAPDVAALFEQLQRVSVSHVGTLSDADVAARMAQSPQALCIGNTRAHARELYNQIKHLEGARHLSTLMCAAHRREVLAGIRQDLKDGKPCRVISTTLIEAGVDVDFPYVLRTEAGLDSIAQAAGRCNREGKLDKGRVEVFAPGDGKRALASLRTYADAGRRMLEHYKHDAFMPSAIEDYFREVYWQKGPDALDRKNILTRLRDTKHCNFPFETIASDFKLIDDIYFSVIVPYGDAAALVEELKSRLSAPHIVGVGDILRKLQHYTVGIPRGARTTLLAAGAAEIIGQERFDDQFVWLANGDLYGECGLEWDNPTHRDELGLIW